MKSLFAALLFLTQPTGVEGTWVNIDDETGVEKSEIVLYVEDGKLYGRIERLLLPEDQGKLCEKCTGKDKNQAHRRLGHCSRFNPRRRQLDRRRYYGPRQREVL